MEESEKFVAREDEEEYSEFKWGYGCAVEFHEATDFEWWMQGRTFFM